LKSFELSRTNSYVESLFDEKVSYLKPVNSLPQEIRNFFDEKQFINDRDRYLSRFQMICLPIFNKSDSYFASLLGYFLRESNFVIPAYKNENYKAFPFKAIALGMFARFEGEGKKNLQQLVQEGSIVDYFYILFDTANSKTNLSLEETMKSVKLETVFGEQESKLIKTELGLESHNLTFKDIIIFHYKNMEIVDETFNTKGAMAGLCVNETEVSQLNEFETTIALIPVTFKEIKEQPEKNNNKEFPEINIEAFLKNVVKENLQIIGLKSLYLNREDLESFKYKVGTLSISDPQPLIVVAIGGFKAIESNKFVP